MYCTTCGAKLPEGARFCTSCGARVEGALADGAAPAGPDSAADHVESEREVAPSASSREADAKVPADGGRPAGLGARILQFRRATLAAVPAWALALLALLLAAGTAYAAYKAVTVWVFPALEQAQGEEEEAVEEATEDVEATEEEVAAEEDAAQTDEQVMYQLYYEKCLEYIELYGEPGVAEEVNEYLGEIWGYTAYGLAGILLIDFNDDGTDELLLAYCTVSDAVEAEGLDGTDSADGGFLEAYQVEVWAYEDGTIECVYSNKASSADGNDYNYSFALYDYEGRICIYTSYYSDEYEGYEYEGYWINWCWSAMGEDGAFETALSLAQCTDGYSLLVVLVNGAEASEEEYAAARDEPELVQKYYLYNQSGRESDDTYLTAQDLVASSLETLELLAASQD